MPVRGPSHFLEAMNSPGFGADGGRLWVDAFDAAPVAFPGWPPIGFAAGAFFPGVPEAPPLTGGETERAAGETDRDGDGLRTPLAGVDIWARRGRGV